MSKKKSHNSHGGAVKAAKKVHAPAPPATGRKLSQQKRFELNNLNDALLKIGFEATSTVSEQWRQYLELQAILANVQSVESELKSKSSAGGRNRDHGTDNFVRWATQNGAAFDGIKISRFHNYELGLEAIRDFKDGELFVVIPRRLMMTVDNVSATIAPILSQMPLIDSMQNVKLAFSLVVERLDPNSFWRPYIELLPEKYSTVMYFTWAEMQELKGSSVLPAALAQCKNIARQYAFIYKYLQNIAEAQCDSLVHLLRERFTYDLYCWAVSTVMTRQNAIPKDFGANGDNGEPSTDSIADSSPALIPLWDFANHMDGVITTAYNDKLNRIEGAVSKNVKKGDQVFIHYGNRNNATLLVHNGFVVCENQFDSVPIRLGLSASDALIAERTKLLEKIGLAKNSEVEVLPAPRYISPELLAFVRIFNMNEEHLKHWLENDKCATDLLYQDCALDTEHETKTWAFLKIRLILLLRAFPTTLEDDIKLIETHQKKGQQKLGHIKSMIIQFRITEKRILKEALEYVEQRTKP